MPNIASAKKALRQSKKRAERNLRVKEQMTYAAKMVRRAVNDGQAQEAQTWLLKVQKIFAKAAQKKRDSEKYGLTPHVTTCQTRQCNEPKMSHRARFWLKNSYLEPTYIVGVRSVNLEFSDKNSRFTT